MQTKLGYLCPYTQIPLSDDNLHEQVEFTCGHVYHTTAFSYNNPVNIFRCCVSGCLFEKKTAVVVYKSINKEPVDSEPDIGDDSINDVINWSKHDEQPLYQPKTLKKASTLKKISKQDYIDFFKAYPTIHGLFEAFISNKTKPHRKSSVCKRTLNKNHKSATIGNSFEKSGSKE